MKYHLIALTLTMIIVAIILACGAFFYELVISSNLPGWLKYLILR